MFSQISGVFLLTITKLLTTVSKITKLTVISMIVMKTQDLDPGVDFVKGEFWMKREEILSCQQQPPLAFCTARYNAKTAITFFLLHDL